VATIAIFLPSFILVAATNPLIPHLRKSKWLAAFLDAVNVSALALMVVVTILLTLATVGTPAHLDWIAVSIAIGSAILGIRFQVNSAWLVLGGGAIGQIGCSLR
jgi:chromate transporter